MTTIRKSRAPLIILAIILSFLVFLAWAANRASTSGTDITDPDYYSKGLKYNSTLLEKKAASVIGWQLQTRLERNQLIFHLTDGNGTPVRNARGNILFNRTGADKPGIPLVETAPGLYRGELPRNLAGQRRLRVEFEQDGARISRQLLLNLPAPRVDE